MHPTKAMEIKDEIDKVYHAKFIFPNKYTS